jgi:hypothetical protein
MLDVFCVYTLRVTLGTEGPFYVTVSMVLRYSYNGVDKGAVSPVKQYTQR